MKILVFSITASIFFPELVFGLPSISSKLARASCQFPIFALKRACANKASKIYTFTKMNDAPQSGPNSNLNITSKLNSVIFLFLNFSQFKGIRGAANNKRFNKVIIPISDIGLLHRFHQVAVHHPRIFLA